MFKTYAGKYFDGESANPIPIEITFNAEDLYIFSVEKNVSKYILLKDIIEIRTIGKDRLIISFQHEQKETIDITFEHIVRDFSARYPDIGKHSFLTKVTGISNKVVAIIFAGLVSIVLGIYFFVVPLIGEMSTNLISKQQEIELGQTLYDGIMESYTIDSARTDLINKMVAEIDFQTEYPIRVTVVHHDEKNAFALPGGQIVIFSDLLLKINDPSELAGLLAHEVSHINLHHSLRSIFRNLASYIFISVLLSDVNGVTTVLIDNANKFKTLSYSRSLEEDADKAGLKIMYHNQLDPNGMVRLFKILMADQHKIDKHLEFLSTHPATLKRIEYLERSISKEPYHIEENAQLDSLWHSMKKMNEID